ncbi:MAG: hypothetical protein OJF62_002470 [Pseudolabrys sp.]|jgi:uncharacterized protein (DUF305 family)|nr:hypothetical protein [Pseudolabrys sp.]
MNNSARIVVAAALALVAFSPSLSAAQQQQPSQASQQYTAAMDRMQSDMKKGMEADPTKTWVKMAIPHHQGLIDMSEIVLRNTKDPKIRKMAQKSIAMQKKDIKELESWLAKHGG